MSVATVPEIRPLRVAPIPPPLMAKIALFLAAGSTGRVVLHIKDGEVRSYEMTEIGDARSPLDEMRIPVSRSER